MYLIPSMEIKLKKVSVHLKNAHTKKGKHQLVKKDGECSISWLLGSTLKDEMLIVLSGLSLTYYAGLDRFYFLLCSVSPSGTGWGTARDCTRQAPNEAHLQNPACPVHNSKLAAAECRGEQ